MHQIDICTLSSLIFSGGGKVMVPGGAGNKKLHFGFTDENF